MFDWRIILLCIIVCAVQSVSAAVDATLQPKANGIEVVRATVRKIRNSCIFPNDYGFLLRVALVESDFGTNPNTFRSDAASGGKGMWQMDQIGFDDTKLVSSTVLSSVKTKLGVDWSTMTYASDNMNVPLYNALAARLLLYRKPAAIPSGLTEQAAYWKTYYNTAAGSGTANEFINKVNSTQTCNTVGADLLIILDTSVTIGDRNFALMKQVVVGVANKLTIGADATQIAVLTFDSNVQDRINFGSYSAVGPLTSAINALRYTGGGTNTHLALNMVETMFQSARSLDTGFPRVVIVLTDGASSNPSSTRLAAVSLNAFSWLERYAVGMGSGINEAELQLIASVCSHVYLIQSTSAISALTDELYDVACRSSVALPPPESGKGYSRMTGTLAPKTQRNARDTAVSRLTGRTYALQVSSGRATLYVSLSIENPSSAINDFSVLAQINKPGVIFVSPSDLAGALSRRRRDLSSKSTTNGTASSILYLSIAATEDSGSVVYQLDTHDSDRRSLYQNSAMERKLSLLGPGFAVCMLMFRGF